ncbi:MAG: arginine N-succinyltransferase [Pseudomonadota bacterium]
MSPSKSVADSSKANHEGTQRVAVIRPVRADDFERVFNLAQTADGGMTNLPKDEDALRARIDHAVASFASNAKEPGREVYLMVLEVGGEILGTTAVFSSIGLDSGFVNYRVNSIFHASEQLDVRIKRRLLVLTHDYTGAGEVGSLFLSSEARGSGLGKLLSRSRYLFIAQSPEIVADPVCAELRGWRAPDGEQPFWNALGKHFFEMEFEDADVHNSANGNQFIADLMPRSPIYACLLPEAARDCIGKPHDAALPALKMLNQEGFEYRNYIDIFDAGPLVSTKKEKIRTVRESVTMPVEIGTVEGGESALIAAGRVETFRATSATVSVSHETVTLSEDVAEALQVKSGDLVRWVR